MGDQGWVIRGGVSGGRDDPGMPDGRSKVKGQEQPGR